MSLFGMIKPCFLKNKTLGHTIHKSIVYLLAVTCSSFLFFNNGKAQADSASIHVLRFNLRDCLSYALKNQHDVKNAILNRQYSQEEVKESTAKLFPHVTINGTLYDYLKLPTSLVPDFSSGDLTKKIPIPSGVKYNSSASGEIDQTIFNSNYFIGLKAAKVYKELSVKSLNSTEINTWVNVSKAYFNVLVNEEAIRISRSNLAQIEKSLKDVKAEYQAGTAETVDVNRIQVQDNNALTGIENQQRLVDLSLAELKFQMGMPQEDSLVLLETIKDFKPGAMPPTDTTGFNLNSRPEYAIQQIQNQLNELNLKNVRLSYLPSLSAYLNYGYNFFSPEFSRLYNNGFGNSALGLDLSFPIFSGTERIHQTNEAKITLQESQNDLTNLVQQIHLEVKNAYTNYQNNQAQLNTQENNMNLTEGVYKRIQYKYEQGVASSLDLLSAENELQQAQSNYIDALLNTLMSRVDLEQALGKINP